MKSSTKFCEFSPDQPFLLPPSLKDWLPDDDFVYFFQDVVSELDLGAIYRSYDGHKDSQQPYHPQMAGLLLYGNL